MAPRYVIDANATLGLFLRLPYSTSIDGRMEAWQAEQATLVVPTIWEYECLTGLRRAVTLKLISSLEARQMLDELLALEFHRVAPTPALHRAALLWADRTGQSKSYDGEYLALAESLSAEFWTADQRLFRNLRALGAEWVHAI
jgi:predicted nucleic acid-binding protein